MDLRHELGSPGAQGNRFFKRWNDEPRGDEHASWGPSVWYLELNMDGWVVRQLEVYDNGPSLGYTAGRPYDDFGGLADQQLEFEDMAPFEIPRDEFEAAWVTHSARK